MADSFTGTTIATNFKVVLQDKMLKNNQTTMDISYTGLTSGERLALYNDICDFSKLGIRRVIETETFSNDDFLPVTAGEKSDKTMLYFVDGSGYSGSKDVPDPDDSCFTVSNGNDLKDYATLTAASAGTPMKGLANFIAAVLDGSIIVKSSNGAQVTAFVSGYRVN